MTSIAGQTFGLIGALTAFSRRALTREVARQGGELQHRVTRRTSHVVFGRSLLRKLPAQDIEARWQMHSEAGRHLLSQKGFLRRLGLAAEAPNTGLSGQSVVDQSKLARRELELLTLFDAFEADCEPYTFRDLILARKYAGLLADGAPWIRIATSVHRSGSVSALTALALHRRGDNTIYTRSGDFFSELNGQAMLPLGAPAEPDTEDLFSQAEEAEESGRFIDAADLYGQCLALDPGDAIASFNQANCLRAAGSTENARLAYLRAVKLDPKFVEAWFNLGCLTSSEGGKSSARRYLQKAIALDPAYADAVFNLASLEFETGNLSEARRLWSRYLQLDNASEWARKAAKGIQYADHQLGGRTA